MFTEAELDSLLLSYPHTRLDYPFGKDAAVYKVLVSSKNPIATHADGLQGAGEQRREAYKKYVERVAEPATQKSVASTDSVSGPAYRTGRSAGKQDSAMRGEWKMFAILAVGSQPVRISLKCDPQLAETLREKYETVMPGYHLNKRHWNTILLTGQLDKEEVKDLIRHSYELVQAQST